MKNFKYLVLAVFISSFLPNLALAESLVLICDIDLKNDTNGNLSQQKIITRVEISEAKNIFISPDSNLLTSVTSKGSKDRIINNLSDDRKWHLNNSKATPSGGLIETEIIIDRFLGIISYNYSALLTGQHTVVSGFGFCEKSSSQKKKF
jgi:hypothetical protein